MKAKLIKKGLDFYSLVLMDNKELLATTEDAEGALKLSIHNCQAIENGYDLDEEVSNIVKTIVPDDRGTDIWYGTSMAVGKLCFQKALEILGDKKFSEEDLKYFCTRFAHECRLNGAVTNNDSINVFDTIFKPNYLILQQTEWDVEIVEVENDEVYSVSDTMKVAHNKVFDGVLFKYDENCCLILKRK